MLKVLIASILFTLQLSENFKFRIIDSETNEGIPFAHIYLKEHDVFIVSNSDGYFNIPVEYSITFLQVSHLNYGINDLEISEKMLEEKLIYLEKKDLILDEILVRADNDLENLSPFLQSLKEIKFNQNINFAFYIQEYVESNGKVEKFSDAIGKLGYDNKSMFVGKIDECRKVNLASDTDEFIELLNPINTNYLFESLLEDYFNKIAKKIEAAENRTILVEDSFSKIRFTNSEIDRKYEISYDLLFDKDQHLIQVDFELKNPEKLRKKVLIVGMELITIKGKYIFSNSLLKFTRLECEMKIDIKDKTQITKFISQASINIDINGTDKLTKKELNRPIYKYCVGHTYEFWNDWKMPIFSQDEFNKVNLILNN